MGVNMEEVTQITALAFICIGIMLNLSVNDGAGLTSILIGILLWGLMRLS